LRAAIVGCRGQLGSALQRLLGGDAVWAGDREELDVSDAGAVARVLDGVRPEVVFNASAWNAVDGAEDAPEAAFAVNTFGPRHLARACRSAGALLVHVSSDYVFDGELGRPYVESDPPRPLNVYGASKLAGEQLVAASGAQHLIVRTSAVFALGGSPDKGGSFVERILAKARRGEPLRVVADQTVSPTYGPDLARALVVLVGLEARGLLHVANSGACSWHELATHALALVGIAAPVERISSADRPGAARRPAFSALACARAAALGLPPLRPWSEALAEMLRP
jgi:dTDP-4-dehydrorhamnose reductase